MTIKGRNGAVRVDDGITLRELFSRQEKYEIALATTVLIAHMYLQCCIQKVKKINNPIPNSHNIHRVKM